MIYYEKPDGFKEDNESAGVILQAEGCIAVLKRNKDEIFAPDKWGFPSGKMKDDDLDIKHTVFRELYEETGILLTSDFFQKICIMYVILPHISFIFHLFKAELKQKKPFQIDLNEHQTGAWVRPEIFLAEYDLADHCQECIELAFPDLIKQKTKAI